MDMILSKDPNVAVADPGGLILLLGEIDSEEARSILIGLTEVYIGSATSEALTFSAIKQGKAIEDDLMRLLSQPISCGILNDNLLPPMNYKYIQCLDKTERDRRIKKFLKYISEGREVEYAL